MGLSIFVFSLFTSLVVGFPSEIKDFPQLLQGCHEGEKLENGCNKCVCSNRIYFECTPKNCNSFEIVTSCRPDTLYVRGTRTCICDNNGKWPDQDCSNIFQNLSDTDHCEPDTYVTVGCNVCRCGPEGKIDKEHCTKNSCQRNKTQSRRDIGIGQAGACQVKNWYSLAPCQFCYCVNENKLVCNTGNNNAQKLELGSYKLFTCGKGLLRDAYELISPVMNKALRGGNIAESIMQSDVVTTNSVVPSVSFRNDINDQVVTPAYDMNNIDVSPSTGINDYMSDAESKSSESEENFSPRNGPEEYTVRPVTSNNLLEVSRESVESKKVGMERNDTGSSNEILVELEKPNTAKYVDWTKKSKVDSNQEPNLSANTSNEDDFDRKLQLPVSSNLPKVLSNVFQMALKDSKVTIVEDYNCKPSTTTAVKCNVCYCTNDFKMICTNTKCA